MKVKRSKTKKLFYNKWIYKINCTINGGWYLNMPPHRYIYWTSKMSSEASQELLIFKSKLEQFKDKDIKLRFEYNQVSIFCNDKDLFKDLETMFTDWTNCVWEPETKEEETFLVTSGKRKCLCKKYPKGLYRYKAYFNKKDMDLDKRNSFYEWIMKYDANIMTVANKTKAWLLGKEFFIESPFLYVSDKKMLSMVCMRLGNGVKLIEEFILESDINTG